MKNNLKIFLTILAYCFAGTVYCTTKENTNAVFSEQLSYAKKGYVEAQKNIGAYYYFGYDGITQDYKKSFEWFQKAAISDNRQAQEMLAYMYSVGQYVAKDEKIALDWQNKSNETKKRVDQYTNNCIKFRDVSSCKEQLDILPSWKQQEKEFLINLKKAESGNSKSQYITSRNYLYGEGTQLNSTKSIEWLTKSSYNKNGLAAYNLATLFFLTQGVSPSFLEFMEIAEALKDEDAILIMKLIRLDERNYHTENYAPITKTIKPFLALKY